MNFRMKSAATLRWIEIKLFSSICLIIAFRRNTIFSHFSMTSSELLQRVEYAIHPDDFHLSGNHFSNSVTCHNELSGMNGHKNAAPSWDVHYKEGMHSSKWASEMQHPRTLIPRCWFSSLPFVLLGQLQKRTSVGCTKKMQYDADISII